MAKNKRLEGFSNSVPTTPGGAAGKLATNALSNFDGFISTKPSAKYMTGARTVLRINGRIAAFATGISWSIKTEGKEIWTIDDYLPHEIAPNKIEVEGTIGGLVIPGQSATSELIQSDVLSFLFHKYITIEVRDSQTDSLLFYAGKAQVTERYQEMKAGGLSEIKLKWKAIGWRDDKELKYPTNYDQNANTINSRKAFAKRMKEFEDMRKKAGF